MPELTRARSNESNIDNVTETERLRYSGREIFLSREYNYFRSSAKYTAHERVSAIMKNLLRPQKSSFCQTLSCNNLNRDITNSLRRAGDAPYNRKLFFAAETFSDRLAYWRTHERGASSETDRRQKSSNFCRAFPIYSRSELRRHYGNNHSRISPAINSGRGYISPVFMAANVASMAWCSFVRCTVAVLLLLLLLLLLQRGATLREPVAPRAGIKKRKIENETVSCRVTVRLNAGVANVQTRTRLGEEGEKHRTMVEARDMRGCGFSASLSRKVSSGLRSFFLVFSSFFLSFFFFCASAVSAAENRDIRSIRHGR